MRSFQTPRKTLGALDATAASQLISASSDLALIVDADGIIKDISANDGELPEYDYAGWLGKPWIDTVTVESRDKITAMLREAAAGGRSRWRHVNHPSEGGDIPLLYSTVRLGSKGHTVAVARSLRALSELQQRLVDAQQSIERDYAQLRHLETRYRQLFQMASEAVLIIDADTLRVAEANPAASALLGELGKRASQQAFGKLFDAPAVAALQTLLEKTRSTGQTAEQRVIGRDGSEFVASVSLFRQNNAAFLLTRLTAYRPINPARAEVDAQVLKLVDACPDAFVVTTPDGRILTANSTFLNLLQFSSLDQVRNESLERWLGRPGIDFKIISKHLKDNDALRLFTSTLSDAYEGRIDVELSAVAVHDGGHPCLGFVIRNISRRLPAAGAVNGKTDPDSAPDLPRSVEQLTELVGRVPLKELVQESTNVIERLCIEAALQLSGDNRASAAEMLGLSRQSLYVKLRRYGLGDLDSGGNGRWQ